MTPDARDHHDLLQHAVAYCEAVWFARADVFDAMCHDRFFMTHVDGGALVHWDKAAFLARVRARGPSDGAASYQIMGIDIAGDMGRVHLWVDVPGLRYEDHLGFVKTADDWKLLTKVFRTAARLTEQGQIA